MRTELWPEAETPALVVVVTSAADLARAAAGWYRVPVAHAPPRLGAEVVALYQTQRCGPDGGQVRWWAPLRRVQLARRCDLIPDEAAHPRADALYWRLDLGALRPLARPVPARRLRRVAFIATTWGRLADAADLADLFLHEPRRRTLGRGLSQESGD
ncbi:MAG: hypothetical protein KIS91_10065 [Anaerolineae bacterium]|nr:hypothetical protein [Anaerolineae bacterium]